MLVDITKDAQQATAEFDWETCTPKLPPKRVRKNHDQVEFDRAVELLNFAKRPVILAGRGIMLSGAMQVFEKFVHTSNIPVAMTLLGIGCFPAQDPMNLGMMGMHGEAWVNTAIQEADLLIAVGMRFDDRVTGDLRTYARNARKIHIEVDRSEINKNVKVDAAIIGDAGETLGNLLPHIHTLDRSAWISHIKELKGDSAVRDIQSLPDSGHLYAAHVINDLWKVTKGNAIVVTDVGPASNVGSAVLSPQRASDADHFGGPGNHGICVAGSDRREICEAGIRGVGGSGRRRIPDDFVRIGDYRAGKD